jgi:hypothetical protein
VHEASGRAVLPRSAAAGKGNVVQETDYQGLVRGKWQFGPRSRTYLARPPSGKAVTHQARNLETGEQAAVMLLRPSWRHNRGVRQDYRHGAELLRKLDHPNVVKVHDLIDDEDLFGLVVEPLPGENLHRYIRYGGRIPTESEVVRFMLEVASGVEHAHERGIVFGNLKPTNVEIFPDGTAKIFALPKPPHQFTSFLDAADYLGFAYYNSPEMLRCAVLDQRTDIYGLGLCAYEMIVSQLPYEPHGNLGADLRDLVTREWPPPAEIVGEIQPLLNKVVVRCLQKDPAKRYASIADLVKDLKRVPPRPAPLISSMRLQEIVTSAFPAPLAVLAQALRRDDHLVAQKDKLLNLGNGLVSYLGFLAAQGRTLEREYRRPSLGHWVGLLREVLQGAAAASWPLEEVRQPRSSAGELLDTLNEVVRLRNRMAHAPAPEEGAVLHDWVGRMTACIHGLYKGLLFLTRHAVVVVEDLDYRDECFHVVLRRLSGVGEQGPVFSITSPQPYTKGRVYLADADGSRLASLHPWIVYAKCPLCFQRELFSYTSADEDVVHYVTADRGHSLTCELPAEMKKLFDS